jgi:PAS domain S-box-containing protein
LYFQVLPLTFPTASADGAAAELTKPRYFPIKVVHSNAKADPAVIPPEFPLDEAARLQALRDLNILDTPPDERFDRLTRLAQGFFGTQTALVSLIDAERQWFKSSQGLAATETPRDISFCGHAIHGDGVFTIPDATEDLRFLDNPLVLGAPNIRLYAGAPVYSPDRHRIGTLCIIDDQPRELSETDKSLLQDLAACVDEVIADMRRQQAREVLAQRESYLYALLESMTDAVLTVDAEGRVRSANRAAIGMLGLDSPAALLGTRMQDWLAEGQAADAWRSERECQLRRGDHRVFPAEVSFNALGKEQEGHLLVILRDISPQRSAEAAVTRGLALLKAISSAQHSFIERSSTEQVFQNFLDELLELTGSQFGLMAKLDAGTAHLRLEALAMADTRWNDRSQEYYRKQLQGPWHFQRAEGVMAEVAASGTAVAGSDPRPLSWGGMVQVPPQQPLLVLPMHSGERILGVLAIGGRREGYDASWASFMEPAAAIAAQLVNARQQREARRESEQRVRDSALELRTLLDTVPTGILKLDEHGHILEGNRAAQYLLLTPAEQLAGSAFVDMLAADARPDFTRQLDIAVRTGVANSSYTEAELWRHNGSSVPVEYLVTPLPAGHGSELTLVMRDITERKAADRAKSEFISTVSHELRTPLTSIRGSLGLILSGTLGEFPEKARRMLDIASRNSERLTQLINDILDMEKISMGAMSFNVTAVSADAAVDAAIAANEGYALRHDVRLHLHGRAEGERISADELRLQQVFSNLISNAIKYSPAGGFVELSAQRIDHFVRFGVRDFGTGVPEEFRERIFQRFSQADSSDVRAKGGTGLGLSIARSIVEQLGGTIGFDTSPQGTEFYFRLPCVEPVPVVAAAAILPDAPADILICEDNPDVAEALHLVLAAQGIACHVARTAGDAERLIDKYQYKLMLLDLGLPDREGLEFLGELRQRRDRDWLPVIIISGREQTDAAAIKALGVSAWLQKPVDPPQLLKALHVVLDSLHEASVLHVEDDRDYAQVIGTMLSPLARYRHVSTLAEARAALAAGRFDIVLLDLGLPDGDGSSLIPLLPPQTVVVLLSGQIPDASTRERAAATLSKGAENQALILETLKQLIERGQDHA